MKITKFTLGLVSGAVIGVLFAPAQGSRSRKAVSNVAGKVNSTFKKWFTNSHSELEELKAILADDSIKLTETDRKKLVQLIDNNQKALKELDV